MGACSVVGCKSRSFQRSPGAPKVSFHKFPKDEERRKLWVIAVRRANWTPNVHSAMCSLHFEDDCFDKSGSFVKLHRHAIPTLFPVYPSHFEDKMKKYKAGYIKKIYTCGEKGCTAHASLPPPDPEEKRLRDEANLEIAAIYYLQKEILQLEKKLKRVSSLYQKKLERIEFFEDDLESSECET